MNIPLALKIVGLLTIAASLWFTPFSFAPMKRRSTLIMQFIYPIILILITLYLSGGAQYTFDFQDQLRLISNHSYEKAHPVFYTLFLKTLLFLFHTPSSIIIVQIITACIACGLVVYFFYRMDLSWIYPFASNTIIICFCDHLITTAVKDAFYYIFFVILMIGLCSWSYRRGRDSLACTFAGLLGVSLFRYDGQFVAIVTSVFLLADVIKQKLEWKKYLGLLSIPIVAMVFFHVIVPEIVHAKPGRVGTGTKYAMPAELICEVLVHGGNITPEEKLRICELIMPEEVIQERHSLLNEYNGEKYIWYVPPSDERTKLRYFPYDYGFNHTLSHKGKEVFELFIPIALKNPGIVIKHLWDQSYLLTSLRTHASIFFYISLLTLFILMFRKMGLRSILPCVPIASVSVIFIVVITTCETRYTTPVIAGGAISWVYAYRIISTKRQIK